MEESDKDKETLAKLNRSMDNIRLERDYDFLSFAAKIYRDDSVDKLMDVIVIYST